MALTIIQYIQSNQRGSACILSGKLGSTFGPLPPWRIQIHPQCMHSHRTTMKPGGMRQAMAMSCRQASRAMLKNEVYYRLPQHLPADMAVPQETCLVPVRIFQLGEHSFTQACDVHQLQLAFHLNSRYYHPPQYDHNCQGYPSLFAKAALGV